MSAKILITAPYFQPVVNRFRPVFEENDMELIVPVVDERLEEEDLLALISDIDGVICGDDRFTERVLKTAKQLKVISKWGTGIDSINLEACERLGIKVCNTLDAFSKPVSDSVLGYILAFARRLPWMDTQMKQGIWDKIPGRSLSECTLGIIGLGNVGKSVAKRAAAFEMSILASDPIQPDSAFLDQHQIKMVDIEYLFNTSDFVSINCDLNPTSHHLINGAAFSMMKENAVIINTARGPIIDEVALVAAINNESIYGAALDVFEHEPLPATSPLRGMDNVMLAPHNSNSSPVAWEHVHQNSIKNLFEVLNGGN